MINKETNGLFLLNRIPIKRMFCFRLFERRREGERERDNTITCFYDWKLKSKILYHFSKISQKIEILFIVGKYSHKISEK